MKLEFYVDTLDLVLPEMLTENLECNKVNMSCVKQTKSWLTDKSQLKVYAENPHQGSRIFNIFLQALQALIYFFMINHLRGKNNK